MLAGHNVYDPNLWPNGPHEAYRGLEGLQWFVQTLYNEGYLNTAGFIHLMHDVDSTNLNSHGEIPVEDWQLRHEYWEPLPQESNDLEANPCKLCPQPLACANLKHSNKCLQLVSISASTTFSCMMV